MSYQPVEIVSREMQFRPEDLIEHKLTSDGRKVKFEHLAALQEMLEELKKFVYIIEQREYVNNCGGAPYIQRLHLYVVPPEQIQVKVYDEIPKRNFWNMPYNNLKVKSQFLTRNYFGDYK